MSELTLEQRRDEILMTTRGGTSERKRKEQ